MLKETTLYLCGTHLPTANFDEVFFPVDYEHVAIGLRVTDVTRVYPATLCINAESFTSGFLVISIAQHWMWAKDLELADGMLLSQHTAIVVHNAVSSVRVSCIAVFLDGCHLPNLIPMERYTNATVGASLRPFNCSVPPCFSHAPNRVDDGIGTQQVIHRYPVLVCNCCASKPYLAQGLQYLSTRQRRPGDSEQQWWRQVRLRYLILLDCSYELCLVIAPHDVCWSALTDACWNDWGGESMHWRECSQAGDLTGSKPIIQQSAAILLGS